MSEAHASLLSRIATAIVALHPELRAYWDLSIFLKVDFNVSVPRGAQRGSVLDSPDPAAPLNQRYVGGQKRYLSECEPEQRADTVIDRLNCVSQKY